MSASCRFTTVGYAVFNTLSNAAAAQFGDTANGTTTTNRVIAIQKAIPYVYRDETRFAAYPLFFLPKLLPGNPPLAALTTRCASGRISVGTFYLLGETAASIVRFGNDGGTHTAESRIVNIRNFNDRTSL